MNKTELLETLVTLAKGIEKNKEIPIYEHICFNGTIAYTSNSLFVITTEIKQKKPFGVHGSTLIGLLQATPADDIKLNVEGTDLHVKAANSNFELPVRLSDEFIQLPQDIEGPVLDPVVAGSMKFLLPTCSENQALEAFSRICIKSEAGLIIMYSTDGDALTKYNTGLICSDRINMTMTRKFCQIIHDITPDGVMTIGKEWVSVKNDKFTVYGRNLGETTLDYAKEITDQLEGDETDTIGKPIALEHTLDRAAVVAKHETSPTLISIKDGDIYFVTETPFGNIYDNLKGDHQDIEVKINAQMLRKQIIDLGDQFELKFLPGCVVLTNGKLLRLTATIG